MKIGFLGAGTWGFCLATLLAAKGHEVVVWTRDENFAQQLSQQQKHPKLSKALSPNYVRFTSQIEECLDSVDLIAEAVTTAGIRPVFELLKKVGIPHCPIVIASKGIEQDTGLLIPEILLDILGEDYRPYIGCISGPGHAEEVCQQLPASVVSSAFDSSTTQFIAEAFTTPSFRVYPNADINGVAFGGAMKNIMAIACGISYGMGLGDGAIAALMTRGLHEIRKLSKIKSCEPETLNGLAGLGDLAVTCMSVHSRNQSFGRYLAEGLSCVDAADKVGMTVEGVYTCRSAYQMSREAQIPIPITEGVYQIIYEGKKPKDVVKALMTRTVKEERL